MPNPPGFHGDFRTDEVARALYAEGAGIFRIVPTAVAVPSGREDLVALVRWAAETGTALVPRGAGSGMPGGNVGPGVVVDLTRGFGEAPAVDPRRRIARAGASVTYAAIEAAAAGHGLRLPPNPASGEFCTIGGMVATNAAGPRSLKYGSIREWVHSIEFVTADGEVGHTGPATTSGARRDMTAAERRLRQQAATFVGEHGAELERARPQVRKNSAGYYLGTGAGGFSLRDLLVGSEGTLAIVTAVTLKLDPCPRRDFTVLVPVPNLDDLPPLIESFRRTYPVAIEFFDRTYLDFVRAADGRVPSDVEGTILGELDQDPIAAINLLGLGPGAILVEDREEADDLWRLRRLASPILAALPETRRSLQLVEDGCVPVESLPAYIAGLRRMAAANGFDIVIFGHAGDGHVHANLLADVTAPDLARRLGECLRQVTDMQLALGGTTSGEHGDGRMRAPFVERLFGATYLEACRLVKRAMDPKGILNPGVKIPVSGGAAQLAEHMLKVGPGAPAITEDVAAVLRGIEKEAAWATFRLDRAPLPAPLS